MRGPDPDENLACSRCGGTLMGWADPCPCGGQPTHRELLRPAQVPEKPEPRRMTWQEAMSELRRRYVSP